MDIHDELAEQYLEEFRAYAEHSGQVACPRHHDERTIDRPCRACGAQR